MMRFSNRVKYGLQFLLFLDVDNEDYTDIQRAALSCDIPHKFLEGIAVDLKKGGVLDVKRGAGGGYRLTRNPREISLGEVVAILEKKESKIYEESRELTRQVVDEVLTDALDGFWQIMNGMTLFDIQKRYYESADKIMYYI
ncbi:RrF2 family transcriptional regulator [Alkaliflexus imshenetskii]|uniref:RrF2 family transcriptional regulator n=1 Tax=Alkaliflexus imshenetskii TaxID=286730 RepID=UPI0004AEFDEB|nr:Rrf2 family transcriptional regulator [Alkaliflexus imshenetskii]